MEEKENKNCCEEVFESKCCMFKNCCMFKKDYMMKGLLLVILLIVVFCLGSQYGQLKSMIKCGYNNNPRGMMNCDDRDMKLMMMDQNPIEKTKIAQ